MFTEDGKGATILHHYRISNVAYFPTDRFIRLPVLI